MTLIEKQSRRIFNYITSYLARKFSITFTVDKDALLALTLANVVGGEAEVWVNGKQEKVKDLQINLVLKSQQNS